MAIYNISLNGGVVVGGCCTEQFTQNIQTLYGPGDIVYSRLKAMRGTLEKVVIKQQKLIKNKRTYNRFVVMYIDTLNGLWNEWDLIELEEAKLLAEDYLTDILVDLNKVKTCK
jgi:hypothetical protein